MFTKSAFTLPCLPLYCFDLSCNKEKNESHLYEYIAFNDNPGPGTSSEAEEIPFPRCIGEHPPFEQDGSNPNLECYYTTYKVAPGFDEISALDPTTDVIYPGVMLLGESIPTGSTFLL